MACALAALAFPAMAAADWQEVVGGASPINVADTDVESPSLASIGGVPYVAWQQNAGGSGPKLRVSIHVKRLNAAGTAWEEVGGQVSVADRNAFTPSLASVGGVPHVAFVESHGGDLRVHVARLNSAGTAWVRVGEGDSPDNPINESASEDAGGPSLVAIEIGGAQVPHVAWAETLAGSGQQIRVARLQDDGSGWDKLGQADNAVSPINESPSRNAGQPSLASIDGDPYVAWSEFDGSNNEIHVARLQDDESGWDKLGQADEPTTPINHSPGGDAHDPSLAGIGGEPYVAWQELSTVSPVKKRVHVARLQDDETGWDEVAGGVSPINQSSDGNAEDPSLVAIGGVPYVAWDEAAPGPRFAVWVARLNADGTAWEIVPDSASPVRTPVNLADPSLASVGGVPYVAYRDPDPPSFARQMRVSRLEPELETTAVAGENGATLVAGVETFGLPYQIGFQYGPGFGFETAVQQTSGEFDLVEQEVTGLSPSATYDYRAFATAGVPAPRVLGAASQFTTDAAPPPDSGGTGDDGSGGGTPDTDAPSLYLGGKKRQELGRSVKVNVECPEEACTVEADGKLVLNPAKGSRRASASGSTLAPALRAGKVRALSAGKVAARGKRTRFRLRPRSAEVPAGETVTLKLGVPKKARSAASKVLRFGGKAKAGVTLSVSDAAENEAVARRTIKLTR